MDTDLNSRLTGWPSLSPIRAAEWRVTCASTASPEQSTVTQTLPAARHAEHAALKTIERREIAGLANAKDDVLGGNEDADAVAGSARPRFR